MKRNSLSTDIIVRILTVASVTLKAACTAEGADIFTRITTGPGSGVAYSRGAAWGDYNSDGFDDLFVPQVGPGGDSARHLLYRNNRDGTFSRVTIGALPETVSVGYGAAWGDYDNDGHIDLVLVNEDEPNLLFHNNGDGSFSAVPDSILVSDIGFSRGVSWVDYNGDGYLDVFRTVLNFEPRRLYRNNHDGTFTPIVQGDFLSVRGTFLGVAWGDYNNDGRPDLFLPNANEGAGFEPNYLFRNDGAGGFIQEGAGVLDGNSDAGAAAWGDVDNDGDPDLFVSCARPPVGPDDRSRPNFFYRNDGNNTFTSLTSLPANDSEYGGGASAGCGLADYDNDGWLDVFVANLGEQNDFLYHNNGDGTFTKVLDSIAVRDGVDSRAPAWGDYDNNGFPDLFVGNNGSANALYHNNGNANHWLKFHLIGTRSNRAAIGAKVRVRATIHGRTFWQMREVSGGDGLRGQNSLHVLVGLGDSASAELVRIEWPSGTVQELSDVRGQQFLTVTEPGGEPQLAATQQNGQMRLKLLGRQGARYGLETSTALPNWTETGIVVTVTNQNGAATFPSLGARTDAQQFYRAVWK